jgi:hypothetical protein
MDIFENSAFRVVTFWEWGGWIQQIIDLRSGREWLYRHPRIKTRSGLTKEALAAPDAYIRLGDLGGWDECCPTVGHCLYPDPPHAGLRLTDHGVCWHQVPTSGRVTTMPIWDVRWLGRGLPFSLSREMRLRDSSSIPSISFNYRLTASEYDEGPFSLLWCAHPLFAIEPGMRLHLDAGRELVVASDGWPCAPLGTRFEWPRCGDLDLSLVTPEVGWAVKLFTVALAASGRVGLEAPDGARIWLRWGCAGANPPFHLGLWLNYGGWSGDGGPALNNLGLEPCLGMPDTLSEAMQQGTALRLEAGQQVRWLLELTNK